MTCKYFLWFHGLPFHCYVFWLISIFKNKHLKNEIWVIPWSPVDKTQHFHCRDTGSVPGQRTKIPQAAWYGQKDKIKMKLESDLWSFCQGRNQEGLYHPPITTLLPWTPNWGVTEHRYSSSLPSHMNLQKSIYFPAEDAQEKWHVTR